jgi:3-isopropylmalate dehydrogenase
VTRIALLPGDGIGPEVIAEARRVLEGVADIFGHRFAFDELLIGGAAIDAMGDPLPPETIAGCEAADAILFGAVGGPKWAGGPPERSPEQGLLGIRRHFGLFANLRPVRVVPALADLSPIKADRLAGVDLLVVRELTGGLYFGPRKEQGETADAYDTMVYCEAEVERIARVAFAAAHGRRKKVTSVDKANVLATSRLWRRTVDRVAKDFPGVTLDHQLVDSCAMQIVRSPASFDVILTENLFGDILSDEAAVLTGSLGLLPSASLGAGSRGLYEPVHGSAPGIAGRGIANPVGAILSAAMLLRHSLGLLREAEAVERAVDGALAAGILPADLRSPAGQAKSTREVGKAVRAGLTVL